MHWQVQATEALRRWSRASGRRHLRRGRRCSRAMHPDRSARAGPRRPRDQHPRSGRLRRSPRRRGRSAVPRPSPGSGMPGLAVSATSALVASLSRYVQPSSPATSRPRAAAPPTIAIASPGTSTCWINRPSIAVTPRARSAVVAAASACIASRSPGIATIGNGAWSPRTPSVASSSGCVVPMPPRTITRSARDSLLRIRPSAASVAGADPPASAIAPITISFGLSARASVWPVSFHVCAPTVMVSSATVGPSTAAHRHGARACSAAEIAAASAGPTWEPAGTALDPPPHAASRRAPSAEMSPRRRLRASQRALDRFTAPVRQRVRRRRPSTPQEPSVSRGTARADASACARGRA